MNKSIVVTGLLAIVLVVAGFACGRALADSGSSSGSGSAVVAPAPTSAAQLHDPMTDPGGAIGDLEMAKKKGWLGLVLVGLYALCKILAKIGEKIEFLAWLEKPRAAMIVAASGTILSGCVDSFLLGGSYLTIGVAALFGLIGLLGTPKSVA